MPVTGDGGGIAGGVAMIGPTPAGLQAELDRAFEDLDDDDLDENGEEFESDDSDDYYEGGEDDDDDL